MRTRIVAIACGIMLAVVGGPIVPASAASRTGTTCVNFYTANAPQPSNEYVIARACISWNDAPDGSKWTQTEQRIWNPPGGVNYDFLATMITNTGMCCISGVLHSGGSHVNPDKYVGKLTSKFEIWVHNYSDVPFCIYMVPTAWNIEHHEC